MIHEAHGRHDAIDDLLSEARQAFLRSTPSAPSGERGHPLDIPVIFDESMPPDVVDFRDAHGVTVRRLVKTDEGMWREQTDG